jgi:hypothetical protein
MKINIERGAGMPGRREVLDDMSRALRLGLRPVHDARWGKATVEVAFAILNSARERREISLQHQVPVPEEQIPAGERERGDWRVEVRIADWPERGIYAKE